MTGCGVQEPLATATAEAATRLAQLRSGLEKGPSEGIALLNDPGNNPICSVTIDAAVPCVVVVWHGYATSTQFRFINEIIIQHLANHKLNKILADDTSLQTVHAEDQTWVLHDWLPRAMAAGLRATANKRPFGHFGKVSVNAILSSMAPEVSARSFKTIAEARRWLESVEV